MEIAHFMEMLRREARPHLSVLRTPLQLVGIQHDGKGAVVYKRNAHVGTEATRLNIAHVRTNQLTEVLVKLICQGGRTRRGE